MLQSSSLGPSSCSLLQDCLDDNLGMTTHARHTATLQDMNNKILMTSSTLAAGTPCGIWGEYGIAPGGSCSFDANSAGLRGAIDRTDLKGAVNQSKNGRNVGT